MKLYREKVRAISQNPRSSMQAASPATQQNKLIDDNNLKNKPPKKLNDGLPIIEPSNDYMTKDTKPFKIYRLSCHKLELNNSNHYQVNIDMPLVKLDKDASMNANTTAIINESDINEERKDEKKFNNFLHIKSVTFSNHNPGIIKRWHQITKNPPVILSSSHQDWINYYHSQMSQDSSRKEKYDLGRVRNAGKKSPKNSINYLVNSGSHIHHIRSITENNLENTSSDPENLNACLVYFLKKNIGSKPSSLASHQGERRILNQLRDKSSMMTNKLEPLEQFKEGSTKKMPNIYHHSRANHSANLQKIVSHANGNLHLSTAEAKLGNQPANLSHSQVLVASSNGISSNASSILNKQQLKRNIKLQEEKKKPLAEQTWLGNYKYYVGPGNNGNLVKRIMSKRKWWEECESFDRAFNFKWQQSNKNFRYGKLSSNPNIRQVVNHFEFHKQISTKNMLIKNLANYCEQNKLYLFDMTPTTFVLDMDDDINFEKDMQIFAQYFLNPNQNPNPNHNDNQKLYESNKNPNIIYNFEFKRRRCIQTTSREEKSLSVYLKPKTNPTFNKGFNVWLLKPTGYNRGRGIEVFNSLENLNQYVNEFFAGFEELAPNERRSQMNDLESEETNESDEDAKRKPRRPIIKSHTFVLQKYIESPLLIHNRKFDIRVWAMVTHEMNLYFFKEGYLRLSSEIFTLNDDNIDNKFVHLTNNAVQKYSENYGQLENGNQLSFVEFEKYIADNNMIGDFRGKILPRMKELVGYSMNSVSKMLNANERKFSFEIFGYDFLIDSDFTVWLIEVNTNPCIEESSPLLEMLLPRMLDDAFKMTIDVLLPAPPKKSETSPEPENITKGLPKFNKQNKKGFKRKNTKVEETFSDASSSCEETTAHDHEEEVVYSVDGYKDDELMWEFLCPLQVVKSPVKKLNTINSTVRTSQKFFACLD